MQSLSLLVLLVCFVQFAHLKAAPDCDKSTKIGEVCSLTPEDVKPSQFSFGAVEVRCKIDRFESMTDSQLKAYLEDPARRVEIIIGPNDKYYLLDGHHMSRALLDADVPNKLKVIQCNVVENWSSKTQEEFWELMLNEHKLWLFDENGIAPFAPEHLSSSIDGLLDDPYRTLAWMVQSAGGYLKIPVPFQDFMWANFLREHIDLYSGRLISKGVGRVKSSSIFKASTPAENGTSWTWCQVRPYSDNCLSDQISRLERVIDLAVTLSESSAASSLPGYGEGQIDPPNCGESSALNFVKYHTTKRR